MFNLNERVLNKELNELATVQFIGRIKNQEFIGISYDNEVGKYDGEFEGVRYFTCEPLHGAFVKPKKLFKSLETLIFEKYISDRSATSEMQFSDGMLDKPVEFKGISQVDKWQSQISKLQSISVSNCGFINSYEEIAKIVPNCEFLDLSSNPIQGNVVRVFNYLKNLRLLDLSGNSFEITENDIQEIQNINNKKCGVFINEIQSNQIEILNRLLQLNFIDEILMNNVQMDISKIIKSGSIQKLQINYACSDLDLCQIVDIISRMPSLTTLSMVNCVKFDNISTNSKFVNNKLVFLNLSKCKVTLNQLRELRIIFPSLKHLRISEIHGIQQDKLVNVACGIFNQTISTFNGGDITPKQTQDFKIYYAQFCLKQEDFQLIQCQVATNIIIELSLNVCRNQILGLSQDLLLQLQKQIIDEQDELEKEDTPNQLIRTKYNNRIIQVVYDNGKQNILVSRIIPIWLFKEILNKNHIKADWIIVGKSRELINKISKYSTLDAIVSDSICSVI